VELKRPALATLATKKSSFAQSTDSSMIVAALPRYTQGGENHAGLSNFECLNCDGNRDSCFKPRRAVNPDVDKEGL
jgi:hypothetical protein